MAGDVVGTEVCRDTMGQLVQVPAGMQHLADRNVPGFVLMEEVPYEIPRIPASAGALIFDEAGRLLILKPTYKAGWTIPGGQVEAGRRDAVAGLPARSP